MFKSLPQRIVTSILLLSLISFLDLFISFEINTAIFYVLPIAIFSYQDKISFRYSFLFATISALCWGTIDYTTHIYSHDAYRAYNWISRYAMFFLVAAFINRYYIEKQLKKIISLQKATLEENNKDLVLLNDKLNKFVGVAAHDIRNPVGAIQMMSEMILEDETLAPEQKNWVRMIKDSAANSLQILNDTLNISQIQSGTLQLNMTIGDYIGFVKDCLVMNNYLAERKQQTISFESGIPSLQVNFDKGRMTQAINNLITNAIKYSETNTAIKVTIVLAGERNELVLTRVIDQGLGIEEKFHARLFDPFITKTGLGLAIVKKIVEMHHGSIDFISEVGKGSEFFFTLPILP
jgi:signal transduction histidine kinase